MTPTARTPTAAVAAFIREMTDTPVPRAARERARLVIADSVSCIIAGAGSELAPAMAAYLETQPGSVSPVLGTAWTATPQTAAMVNGAFGAALDFDDLLSPTHPSAVVVAALCSALPDREVPGVEFIDAYVVGIEVGAKIAAALGRGRGARGYHATATLSGFSAFAALAHLHRLSPERIETGIGLVASAAGGLLCQLGTMTKPLHSGQAAQQAVTAMLLAEAGVTAARDALEAKFGFFRAYGDAASDPSAIAPALGAPWAVLEPGSTLKRFPSCIAQHRAIAAVLALKAKGVRADNLAALDVSVAPGALQPLMYPRPRTGLEAKFSMPYAVAAALLDERLGIATFETPAVGRPEIAAIIEKVSAWEDPAQIEEDPVAANLSWGFRGHARVTARLLDGTEQSARVDVPPGHPSQPLGWPEMREKFLDCAASARLDPARAARAFEAVAALPALPDVREALALARNLPEPPMPAPEPMPAAAAAETALGSES